jgi:hypothetical protein
MNPHQILPTLKRYILTDGFRLLPDFDRSRGSEVVDLATGEATSISAPSTPRCPSATTTRR